MVLSTEIKVYLVLNPSLFGIPTLASQLQTSFPFVSGVGQQMPLFVFVSALVHTRLETDFPPIPATLAAIMSIEPVFLLIPAWTLNIIMFNGQHEM